MSVWGRALPESPGRGHNRRGSGNLPPAGQGDLVENKVVVHTLDGRIVKGLTLDLRPDMPHFHVLPGEGGGVPVRLAIDDVKGVFYVKDFLGNRDYDPPPGFGPAPDRGRRCIVTFQDGEVIFGTTPDFDPQGTGFTLYPSDPADNNVKIFVGRRAVTRVEFP